MCRKVPTYNDISRRTEKDINQSRVFDFEQVYRRQTDEQ